MCKCFTSSPDWKEVMGRIGKRWWGEPCLNVAFVCIPAGGCPETWALRNVFLLKAKLLGRRENFVVCSYRCPWVHLSLALVEFLNMLTLLFSHSRDGCFKWWFGQQWPFQRHGEHNGGPHPGLLGHSAVRCCRTPHSIQPELVDTAEYWCSWKPEGRWVGGEMGAGMGPTAVPRGKAKARKDTNPAFSDVQRNQRALHSVIL